MTLLSIPHPQPSFKALYAFDTTGGVTWLVNRQKGDGFRGSTKIGAFRPPTHPERDVFPGRSGQLWIHDGTEIRGLAPPVSFHLPIADRLFLHEAPGRRLWAASPEGDLWELLQDDAWETWNLSAFEGATPVQILATRTGDLIGVTDQRLFRLDNTTRRWIPFGDRHEYAYLFELASGGFLASIRKQGVAHLSPKGHILSIVLGSDFPGLRSDFRKMVQLPHGRILLGHKDALLELTDNELQPLSLPDMDACGTHAVDFDFDSTGQLHVGYCAGIARLNPHGIWERVSLPGQLPDIRSFASRRPGEFWIAHRSKGFFSRLHDGHLSRFTLAQGFAPPETYFLKTDRRGWVWRGTKSGVFVSDGIHFQPQDWLYLDTGGEAAQFGFIQPRDGDIWIASSNGIARFKPNNAWFIPSRTLPRLTQVVAGDQSSHRIPDQWDPSPRTIAIHFARTGAPTDLWQPLRYRLFPLFEDWRLARDGRIVLDGFPNGAYRLEVKFSHSNAVWSKSFRLGPSPWWQRLPWLPLFPILAVATWMYRRRDYIRYRLLRAKFDWKLSRSNGVYPPPLPDLSGHTLRNRYYLVRLISAGGFADVYEGRDTTMGRPVAVKVLRARAGDAAWVRTRFAHEVAALHSINHPMIVRLLDSWVSPTGEPCLVLDHVNGQTLRDVLRSGPYPLGKLPSLIRNLGEAVSALHQAGVIHRDLKPENIIIRPDGFLVLVDLGACGLLGLDEDPAVSHSLAGTIDYLAPECLTHNYSPASDIYACAVIIFELIKGTMFSTSGLSPLDRDFEEKLGQQIERLISSDAGSMIAAALNPFPQERPQKILQWSQELASRLSGPLAPATPTGGADIPPQT